MEIKSLRFIATEADLNHLVATLLTPPPKVRDLVIRVMPDGLSVMGVYETLLPIPFESFWQISVGDGKVAARFSGIKALGVTVDFLKTYILNALHPNTIKLELRDETFFLDVDRFLAETTVPIQTNLTSVRCEMGQLVIECGHVG